MATEDNDYGMSGAYLAIWRVLRDIVEEKNAQSEDLFKDVAAQIDGLRGGQLDRGRVDSLIRQLDNITTPDAPGIQPRPQPGNLDFTHTALPDITARQAEVPEPPVLRELMEIGPAPNMSDAGEDMDQEAFRNLFVQERDQLLALVRNGFDEFLRRFMPAEQEMSGAMSWLEDAIHARNTGIPVHIEVQIHERNRARISKETGRQIDTAMNNWAARGYTLPPGTLVGQVAQIRRDQHDQLATSSRELAIHITDKHIENARFAVEQMLGMRNQALAHAMDYMRSLLLSPQHAGQWITSMLDNRTKVAGVRADIYKARAGVATDVLRTQVGADVDTFKALTDAELQGAKSDNDIQVAHFQARLDQDRLKFTAAIEEFKARTGNEVEVFRTVQDALTRYYEASTRVAGLKAEVLGKTAETALRIEELQFGRDTQLAKMKAELAMELLKTVSQQTAAALNNLQMNAGSNTSFNYSKRLDEEE